MKLLLSINPEHVERIFRGTKRYEFRKVESRQRVDGIVVYCTAPISMIVGEVEVVGVLAGSPETVWQQTAELSGISEKFFERYFRGKKKAIAYQLGAITRYETPKRLADIGVGSAPQSFVYLPA